MKKGWAPLALCHETVSTLVARGSFCCAGVVTGAGKQLHGAAVNFIAYYVIAVPVSACLAFLTPMWVYGLYLGLSLGPLVQSLLYGKLILTINWAREAHRAYMSAHAD